MNNDEDVARLRARVAELEGQVEASGHRTAGTTEHRSRWRSTSSAILIVVACVLAPLSVTSVWASSILSDADRYVSTVAPIADDPGVQAAITNAVTTAIIQNLDVDGLTTRTLDALAQSPNLPPRVATALPALAAPLSQGIATFTHDQVSNLVASPKFASVWNEVNRVAHAQVVKLLEGNQGGVVSAQADTITLNLAPVIAEVKQRLLDRGFGLASNIPTIDKSFVLVKSQGITQAQTFYVVLNKLGLWLPFIATGLFGAGVLLAHDRRRSLLRGALGVALSMVALGVALSLVRSLYVETTPAHILTPQSAGAVFENLVQFLRSGLRAVGVLALLVALAAFLTGPATAAVRTRSTLSGGIGSLRGSAESAGLHTGRFGSWVYARRRGLRLAAFLTGGLALLLWTNPTVGTVLVIALLVVLALVLIEFLAGPPAPGQESSGGSSPRGEAAPFAKP